MLRTLRVLGIVVTGLGCGAAVDLVARTMGAVIRAGFVELVQSVRLRMGASAVRFTTSPRDGSETRSPPGQKGNHPGRCLDQAQHSVAVAVSE